MLRDMGSKPPSLEEVKASLPAGVRLVSYQPQEAPFAVAPVSVVTDAGLFFRGYLRDLAVRLEKPQSYACPPLGDILGKLADGGLKLALELPAAGENGSASNTNAELLAAWEKRLRTVRRHIERCHCRGMSLQDFLLMSWIARQSPQNSAT